jgi:hypothetical protein
MDAPKKVMPGDVLTAASENELRAYVKSLQITKVVGGRYRRTADGTTIVIGRGRKSRGGGGECSALYADLAQDEGGWFITVRPGYVNNFVPEIGGNEITDVPAPELTVSAAGDVYVKITWEPGSAFNGTDYIPSGGTITDVDIIYNTSTPTDTEPEVNTTTGVATVDGVYHFIIATVTYDGVADSYSVAARRAGHRFATICGEECRVSWNGC